MTQSIRFSLFALIIVILAIPPTHGQNKKRRGRSGTGGGNLSNDQWWIGFKSGLNSSAVANDETYAVFSNTGSLSQEGDIKKYENISKYGAQVGLIIAFEFVNNLSISLQPETVSYKFGYKNEYQWFDFEDTDNALTLNLDHDHTLRYFEVPLLLRYDFHISGESDNKKPKNRYEASSFPIIPYAQFGIFYGKLLSASKSADISGTNVFSGATSELQSINQTIDMEPLLLSANWGLVGGIGLSHKISNARISLEANYKQSMVNITNTKERFGQNELVTDTYDVLDDIKLRNIELSFRFIMPLKFITSKNYNAL